MIERDEEERGKVSVLVDTIRKQSPMVPREELLKMIEEDRRERKKRNLTGSSKK